MVTKSDLGSSEVEEFMKISVIIITRNEDKNIFECIKNLSFASEIIVVDNESQDKTVSVAKKLGAKVYVVPGQDFSYLRNIGKEKADFPWILYVDADERVTEELAEEMKAAIKNTNFCAYALKRKNYYLGYPWPKIEEVTRLIKKDSLIGWQGSLHESPKVTGDVGELHSYLLHYTHRDLTSMVTKTNEWSDIEARLRYQSEHPKMTWWRFFRVMFTAFYDSYFKNEGWKVGTIGLIESIYQTFSIFITYAKLWELQNKEVKNNKFDNL